MRWGRGSIIIWILVLLLQPVQSSGAEYTKPCLRGERYCYSLDSPINVGEKIFWDTDNYRVEANQNETTQFSKINLIELEVLKDFGGQQAGFLSSLAAVPYLRIYVNLVGLTERIDADERYRIYYSKLPEALFYPNTVFVEGLELNRFIYLVQSEPESGGPVFDRTTKYYLPRLEYKSIKRTLLADIYTESALAETTTSDFTTYFYHKISINIHTGIVTSLNDTTWTEDNALRTTSTLFTDYRGPVEILQLTGSNPTLGFVVLFVVPVGVLVFLLWWKKRPRRPQVSV